MRTAAIILAADEGVAMHSKQPKCLHPVCGKSLINHVISAIHGMQLVNIMVVVPPGMEKEVKAIGNSIQIIQQPATGKLMKALLQAESSLEGKTDLVLLLPADLPLIQPETLGDLVKTQEKNLGPLTLLVSPSKYESSKNGIKQISNEDARVTCTCFSSEWLLHFTRHTNSTTSWEEFLTAAVDLAVQEGLKVAGIPYREEMEANKVETRLDLANVEAAMRSKINSEHMLAGVTMIDPATTYIDKGVKIGEDTIIWPNTHLRGSTVIGRDCRIGPNTIIQDSQIGNGCEILSAVLEKAVVEDNVSIGPFAHLRKGAHLCEGVHMGNFGEVKESVLGPGTKMGHFSYIGNATIGQNVNIGAGTITCNFDGVNKNPTEIGEGAFIGSDTMLVAPVKIGAKARTGAGAVVTRDVEQETIVVGVPARVLKKVDEDKND